MWKLVVPLALAGVIAGAMPSEAQEPSRREITVTGEGRVSAASDVARVTLGVETRDPSAMAALEANNRRTSAVIGTLTGAGIPREEIRTAEILIRREFAGERGEGSEPAYVVTNAVTVSAPVDRIGEVLDATVAAGANVVQGISFGVSDEETLADEALKRAVEEARRKAELLAAAAGTSVGDVLVIAEGTTGGPRPMMEARLTSAAAVPVEGGRQEITASVTVTFALAER